MPLSYKDTSSPVAEPLTLDDAKAQLTVADSFTNDDDLISALIIAARQHVEKLMQRVIYPRTMNLYLDFFPFPAYGDSTINPNDRNVLYGFFWHALAIKLPKPPCLSVQSITYIPLGGGPPVTLDPATYYVDVNSEPARIVPQPGLYWPYTQSWLPNGVCVSFTVGAFVKTQTDALAVPAAPGPYVVQLTRAADALGIIGLFDSVGGLVAYSNSDGALTVDASFAGQILTASYYLPDVPQPVLQAMLLLISYWYAHRDAAEAQPPKAIEIGVDALLGPYKFDTFGI